VEDLPGAVRARDRDGEPRKRVRRRLPPRPRPTVSPEKLFTAISLGVGLVLCLGTLVTLALVLRPESDSPFRAHMAEYLAPVRPRGPLNPGQATGKMVVVDVNTRKVDPVHFELPDGLRARSAEEVRLVVRLKWERKEADFRYGIERWEPQGGGDVRIVNGGGSFQAYRWDCQVEVIERATGRRATQSIRGIDPNRTVHSAEEMTGLKPTDQVLAFLQTLPPRQR
jgi:hypothetical protein